MVILSRENPLEGAPLGENLQEAKGRAPGPSLDTLLVSYQVPTGIPICGEGTGSLSTRPKINSNFPQNPTLNPFFTNYSCSPEVFSPIISFNEPSEYVFNMFFFHFTPVTFSLVRTIGPYWYLQLNGETHLLCPTLTFHLIWPRSLLAFY